MKKTTILLLLLAFFLNLQAKEYITSSLNGVMTLTGLNYDDLLSNRDDLKKGKTEVVAAYNKMISSASAILKWLGIFLTI